MNIFSFKKSSRMGLDIQPKRIYLIKLYQHKHIVHLEDAFSYDLPGHIFLEDKIKEWDELSALLAERVQIKGWQSMPASIQLSINLVHEQRLLIPTGLTEKEIESEIFSRIQRDLRGTLDHFCIDFIETKKPNSHYSDLVYVAARETYLSRYKACVEASGLRVKIVDIDFYALARAIIFIFSMTNENEVFALFNNQKLPASLIFFTKQHLIFHHCCMHEDPVEWEELKQILDHFTSTFPDLPIQKIIFCADIFWREEAMKEKKIPMIMLPDYFSSLSIAPAIDKDFLKKESADFLIAFGLALSEIPIW